MTAHISYFQNEELEDEPDDEMEDDYEKDEDSGEAESRDGADDENAETAYSGVANEDKGMERLMKMASNKRQLITQNLSFVFLDAVKSETVVNVPKVFESLNSIINDPEISARSNLIERLPAILEIYQSTPAVFSENPTKRILKIVVGYLHDSVTQVRQDAMGVIKTLLDRELLDEECIVQDLCQVITDLFSNDSCPDLQTLALSLMMRVNTFIGDELTEKLYLDRFLELCQSDGFFVRRVCASIMGEFCAILSKEAIYNKLLPAYAKLCVDPVWGVRKTTVDVMMSVSRCVPLSMRRHILTRLLVHHLRDESRWVRRAAYENLGPFISTFAKQFHELICDQKGELVLVHENERGWPQFNVVPVAKYTDILSANLDSKVRDCPTEDNKGNRRLVGDGILNSIVRQEGTTKGRVSKKWQRMSDAQYYKQQKEDYENFNTFQYYYNPPDTPLDMDFVESIINDNTRNNENTTNTDENVNSTNNADNSGFNVWAAELEQIVTSDEMYQEVCERLRNEHICDKTENDTKQEQKNSDENNANYEQQQMQQQQQRQQQQQPEQQMDNNDNEHKEVRLEINDKNEENREDSNSDDEEGRMYSSCGISKSESHALRSLMKQLCSIFKSENRSLRSLMNEINEDQSISSINEIDLDDNELVPHILLGYFVSMADFQDSNDIGPDIDYHCAFSFPAVVLTLGKENWPLLKKAYQSLAGAMAWKVRSTLASSIHEIAMIIGRDYTTNDLVPIFNGFIKDLDEVRIGALKHLNVFLNVLSPLDRSQYLIKLSDFLITDSQWNWRLREELVKQLSLIVELYHCIDVAKHIAPLLLHLLQDRVAAVRQETLNAVANTVSYLKTHHHDEKLAVAMIQEMRELLKRNARGKWVIRQTYAFVCQKLLETSNVSGEMFMKELYPYLFELSYDKVPNVRLIVVRTLCQIVYYMPNFVDTETLNGLKSKLRRMQTDSDKDVRETACGPEAKQNFD